MTIEWRKVAGQMRADLDRADINAVPRLVLVILIKATLMKGRTLVVIPTQASLAKLLRKHKQHMAGPIAEIESARIATFRPVGSLGLASSDLDLSSGRFSFMCAEEVRGLGLDGCDIQLHGHEHRYPTGEPDVLRRDLSRCQSSISALGLPPARHYCYPSGEYDAHAPELLAGMGIASATTCVPGLIRPSDKPNVYLLPRFLDGEDVSMLDFEAEMSGVLELARKVRRTLGMRTLLSQKMGAVNS